MLMSTLFAAWLLWGALPPQVPALHQPAPLPAGHVLTHADLDGNGQQDLIVALPGSCDDDGNCVIAVYVAQPAGGYAAVLSPTRMWDLSPSPSAPDGASGWIDLVEAKRDGPAPDDITVILWRFDGREYHRVQGSQRSLSPTPDWASRGRPIPHAHGAGHTTGHCPGVRMGSPLIGDTVPPFLRRCSMRASRIGGSPSREKASRGIPASAILEVMAR